MLVWLAKILGEAHLCLVIGDSKLLPLRLYLVQAGQNVALISLA